MFSSVLLLLVHNSASTNDARKTCFNASTALTVCLKWPRQCARSGSDRKPIKERQQRQKRRRLSAEKGAPTSPRRIRRRRPEFRHWGNEEDISGIKKNGAKWFTTFRGKPGTSVLPDADVFSTAGNASPTISNSAGDASSTITHYLTTSITSTIQYHHPSALLSFF